MKKRVFDNLAFGSVCLLMAVSAIFLILPIAMSVVMSFDARPFLGAFPPAEFSLRWYEKFFTTESYLLGLKSSLVLACLAAFASTVLGVSAAVIIDKYEFFGRELLITFFLSPLMIPGVVTGFALLLFFSIFSMTGGYLSLFIGHTVVTLPYAVRATLAGLSGISETLNEAALSLGATERQAFWDITLPLGRTGMVAGAIFAFAFSMDEVAASIFLTTPTASTLPVTMISMMRSSFDLSLAACAVFLIVLTGTLIFILEKMVGLDSVIGQGTQRH